MGNIYCYFLGELRDLFSFRIFGIFVLKLLMQYLGFGNFLL